MKFDAKIKLVSLISLCCFASSTLAQVLPGSANPAQVSRALSNGPTPPSQKAPPPSLEAGEKGPPISPEAKKIKFRLNVIRFKGNHIYSEQTLRQIYADKIGKEISVADLFLIVQDITNYYRNNGYILSRAILPPQRVKGGVIVVQIVEGYIYDVQVTGQPGWAGRHVLRFGRKITYCRPVSITNLERYMLLANEIPGASVKAVLAPSKEATGAADLNMVTTFTPVTGYLSYDNYGTRYIGPQQMTANLSFNSWILSGDALAVTFTKTPRGGELTYRDINYNVPLNCEGARGIIGSTVARTHPMFVLTPQDIRGININDYLLFQFPLIRTRTQSLTLRTGFYYNDAHVDQLTGELYTDHIRTIAAGVTYNFSDSYYGANLINFDLRQGLPIFGYTSDTSRSAQTSRPGGTAVYTKLYLTLSRIQAIKYGFSLYGVFNGQWSPNPLLSSEQFAYGGSQIGRGYDIAELIGDKGWSASLELRYDLAVNRFWVNNLQFYAFYDAGMVWNYITTTNVPTQNGLPSEASGTSTGVGMRFFFTKIISGNVMWAQPLTHKVLTETETEQVVRNGQIIYTGNGWRPRVFFSIIAALD